MPNLASINGHVADERKNLPSPELVLPDCYMGLEVETSRCSTGEIPLWSVHEDGSLHEGGVEFVFANPLFGVDIITALDDFEYHVPRLLHHDSTGSSSNTSTHVHIDMREVSDDSLAGFMLLGFMLEPLIFNALAPNRANNIFCSPLVQAKGDLQRLGQMYWELVAGNTDRANLYLDSIERYAAINLRAMQRFGTVEFRMFNHSHSAEELLLYINVVQSIKRAVVDGRVDTTRPYLSYKDMAASMFLHTVFDEEIAEELISRSTNSPKDLLDHGSDFARAIVNCWADYSPVDLIPTI